MNNTVVTLSGIDVKLAEKRVIVDEVSEVIIHHYFLFIIVLKFFQGNNNDIEDKEALRAVDDYINKSIIDENSDNPLIAGVFYIEICMSVLPIKEAIM